MSLFQQRMFLANTANTFVRFANTDAGGPWALVEMELLSDDCSAIMLFETFPSALRFYDYKIGVEPIPNTVKKIRVTLELLPDEES